MIDADTIHDYLDGDLDETTARELAQWLLAAPENRSVFRREVALAATLAERAAPASPSQIPDSTQPVIAGPVARVHPPRPQAKTIRRPSRRLPFIARFAPRAVAIGSLAAVVVVSAILVLHSFAAQRIAKTSEMIIGNARGPVSVVRADKEMAMLPTDLQVGDEVHIGAQGAVRLEMDHGRTRIWAEADTTLRITSIHESRNRIGTRLDITQGKLLIEAAPQPPQSPLRICSPRSEAEVIGTILSFAAMPDHDRLEVGRGAVAYGQAASDQRTSITGGGFGEIDGIRLTLGRLDHQPPPAVTKATLSGFALVDDKTGQPVHGYAQLTSGCVIDLAELHGIKINIRAAVSWPSAGKPGHVVFHYDDHQPIAEGGAPYTVLSDALPLAATIPPERFSNGIHALVATPYSEALGQHPRDHRPQGGNGSPGQSATLIFTVINARP